MEHPFLKPESIERIKRQMEEVGIHEDDLDERFILGSGSGGQKVNKTSSAVQLIHAPTNTIVKTQATRSREVNRWIARRKLVEALLAKVAGEKTQRQREEAKIRRQKQRRSRKQKAKMLADKRHHAGVKANRKPVDGGE